MNNASSIISLRNIAIMWIAACIGVIVLGWWSYGYFSEKGKVNLTQIQTLSDKNTLLRNEGVITDKKWEDLDPESRKNERWATIIQLVPSIADIAGVGTPEAARNIEIIKNISVKTGDEPYATWLQKSWTTEAQSALSQAQANIAEVIPVFAGVSELAGTENIPGKISLKSFVEYIQSTLVDAFEFSNALGDIGIDRVKFLEEAPEIGVYEIPLKFENAESENIMSLLDFLGKTGGIKLSDNGQGIIIENRANRRVQGGDRRASRLRNLLITVKDLKISTAAKNGGEESTSIEISPASRWNVDIILQFYIRGVSRDHISTMDATIAQLLGKTGSSTSLIAQAGEVLNACGNCSERGHINDIIGLLNQATKTYDTMILAEKTKKTTVNPIEILTRRSDIITTLRSLEQKIQGLDRTIKSSSKNN